MKLEIWEGRPKSDDGWRDLMTQYPGVCQICKEPIPENRLVLWHVDYGIEHLLCGSHRGVRRKKKSAARRRRPTS